MRSAPLSIPCLVFAALALAGCSGFNSEYKAIATSAPPPNSIEGAWEGRWQSNAGHGGDKLRAILTKNGPDTYLAKFRASYWGIFEADQETLLRVTGTNPVHATGESDLGYLKGGTYRYEATITPEKFDATYKSTEDHGVFEMARPKPRQ
jgi:hypothetical protein